MPINLEFFHPADSKKDPFSRQLRRDVQKFVEMLEVVTEIPMKVRLVLMPSMVLTYGHKDFAVGHCYDSLEPIVIHVACFAGQGMADLYDTICHEVAHVEQVRDGRKVTERGVKVRARNLVKKVLGEFC